MARGRPTHGVETAQHAMHECLEGLPAAAEVGIDHVQATIATSQTARTGSRHQLTPYDIATAAKTSGSIVLEQPFRGAGPDAPTPRAIPLCTVVLMFMPPNH